MFGRPKNPSCLSMTLVWPHFVRDVSFVSNWIYFLILLLLMFFSYCQAVWGRAILANCIIDDSILPLGYAFIFLLRFLRLWPLLISLISDFCVGWFILDVEFKFWGTFFLNFVGKWFMMGLPKTKTKRGGFSWHLGHIRFWVSGENIRAPPSPGIWL